MSKNDSPAGQDSAPSELAILPSTHLRINTRDVMERVKFRGERILIETFGRPMVVLISLEDYLCIRNHLLSTAVEPPPSSTPSTAIPNSDGNAGSPVPGPFLAPPGAPPIDLGALSQDA